MFTCMIPTQVYRVMCVCRGQQRVWEPLELEFVGGCEPPEWVLETDLGSSARTVGSLKHRAISLLILELKESCEMTFLPSIKVFSGMRLDNQIFPYYHLT